MWIGYISSASILLPLLFGVCNYRNFDRLKTSFFIFIVISLIFDIAVFYTGINDINNQNIFKLFLFFDFAFAIIYFNKVFKFRKWIWYLIISLLLLVGFNELNLIFEYNNYKNSAFSFILIFLFFIIQSAVIMYLSIDDENLNPFNKSYFLIAGGRLFYYMVVFFLFLYPNLVIDGFNSKLFGSIFLVSHAIANITCNLIYTRSFYAK